VTFGVPPHPLHWPRVGLNGVIFMTRYKNFVWMGLLAGAFSAPIRPLIPGRFRPPIPVKTGHRSGAFRPPLMVA
jgi:hypothetical protein